MELGKYMAGGPGVFSVYTAQTQGSPCEGPQVQESIFHNDIPGYVRTARFRHIRVLKRSKYGHLKYSTSEAL